MPTIDGEAVRLLFPDHRLEVFMPSELSSMPDLDEPLPPEVAALVEQGRTVRTQVLPGTEGPKGGLGLYAKTHVEIAFRDEENLVRCVKLLRWSDDRLRQLPDLIAMWEWLRTERDDMSLFFSTGWYDEAFYRARNAAFLGRDHARYFAMFGASVDDLKTENEIM
jgi:hypothetical protein